MFHSQSCTRSAVSRGIAPQGKGREGMRKGKGMDLAEPACIPNSLVAADRPVRLAALPHTPCDALAPLAGEES